MMHAIGVDMFEWWVNHPDQTPALVVANAGYDVWFPNNRGTRWSNKHVSLDPKSKEYSDAVDWENMGTQDIPAVIDFITKKTGYDKVSYFGHS